MLHYDELVEHLENKGIAFNIIGKEEAKHFLAEHNYYVKLTSYRFNYPKNKSGTYVGLDFFHLKELSTIDMHLKFLILKTCLNIEHSIRINLLNSITEHQLDEFKLVSLFEKKYPRSLKNIDSHRNTSYCKRLLNKYEHPHYPAWVLFEVMPFGDLIKFYEFYSKEFFTLPLDYRLLYNVSHIRNACAHNNCLIHDLGSKPNTPNQKLRQHLIDNLDAGKGSINNKLRNESIHDFVAMLYVLNQIVKSDEIKFHRLKDLNEFFNGRMIRSKDRFQDNNLIKSSYHFTKKVLDYFLSYNTIII
ncbi:MAG: Abi family protein [Peptoniphilus sp.]|nr:Abi family protein [Peptoniphilus sp.]MDY6045118.1 Abi family protein [Peptoniphilus sp.]